MSYVGTESLLVDAWLVSVLRGDTGAGGVATLATGGIHQDLAPQGASTPYVTWQHQSPPIDQVEIAGIVVAVEGVLLIKVTAQGESYAPLRPIIERIAGLLHRQSAELSGGRILACVRERAFRQPALIDGVHYRTLGYFFRYQAQST